MGRAPCCDKSNVKRGPWSPEEDATLRNYLERHGNTAANWIALPHKAGLRRCGKSCRLRWLNYLRPDIKHGCFTPQEDHIISTLYNSIGSRWSVIASQLPGRTDNDVKNYWNTKLKKKQLVHHHHHHQVVPPVPKVMDNNIVDQTLYYYTPNFLFSSALAVGMSSSYDHEYFLLSAPFPINLMQYSTTTTSTIQLPPQTADDDHLVVNHVLVSPPEDGSYSSSTSTISSSSADHKYCSATAAAADLFLQEFGFGSYSDFLAAGSGGLHH